MFTIEIKKIKMKNSIFVVFFMCMKICSCFSQEDYFRIDNFKINKTLTYYETIKEYDHKAEYILVGYMGINDSITIELNGKVMFQDSTKYQAKHGYGHGILKIPRSALEFPSEMYVFLHGPKVQFIVLIEEDFNSILIQNHLNEFYKILEQFEGYLMVYYYHTEWTFVFYEEN